MSKSNLSSLVRARSFFAEDVDIFRFHPKEMNWAGVFAAAALAIAASGVMIQGVDEVEDKRSEPYQLNEDFAMPGPHEFVAPGIFPRFDAHRLGKYVERRDGDTAERHLYSRKSRVLNLAADLKKVKKWTPEQTKLLALAYVIGEEIGWPETIQSILYQETLAGKLGRVSYGGDAFGIAQVQPDTARFVMRHFDDIEKIESNEELIKRLKNDDYYNLQIGARYFLYNLRKFDGDWRRAVVGYNFGHNAARRLTDEQVNKFKYLVELREKLRLVREFNELVDIKSFAQACSKETELTRRAGREIAAERSPSNS